MLRVEPAVVVPAPLSDNVAGEDQNEEVFYYASKKYDRVSLQVFLRDILRPLSMKLVTTFRPVPGGTLIWENPDVDRWAGQQQEMQFKVQLGLLSDPAPPRVARIEIHPNEDPPRLVLQCERERPFEVPIYPKEDRIALRSWWHLDEERVGIVHPAFWTAAVAELTSLLKAKQRS